MEKAANNPKPVSGEVSPIAFKAETRQLLNILIHSLYTEREIFLRELISNASDALTRIEFEMLTNRDVRDADTELAIRIIPNPLENTLTIQDKGIGMTADELVENLGTIAHSGAHAFLESIREGKQQGADIIGQFGVGFYSAFMVADWIQVTSCSYDPHKEAATWYCDGSDSFTVTSSQKSDRGTDVVIKLKGDASEFIQNHRLRDIIRKHSDFIPYPIYLGEDKEQINRQTALWRQSPRQVKEEEYINFFKEMTLEFEPPLAHAHLVVDAPVQMYALLFVPAKPERSLFSLRKEDGLRLYSHKVLIQEYCKDLLPDYLHFVQGVVASEDLPLNVSRETVQSNRVMAQLRKLITSKVLDSLEKLAKEKQEKYNQFWEAYGQYIKQGVATEQNEPEDLHPLLRFKTVKNPAKWASLDDYVEGMHESQDKVYYIIGDDERSVLYSPHLDLVHKFDYDALILADPIDAFMLVRLTEFKNHPLANVATADLIQPSGDVGKDEAVDGDQAANGFTGDYSELIERFKIQLAERVLDVRLTERLQDSPARLVDTEGSIRQEMQRVYRILNRDFETPKKILELNPKHPIIAHLSGLSAENEVTPLVIEQIYENALLIEGLHPDPASMITRIHKLIELALDAKEGN